MDIYYKITHKMNGYINCGILLRHARQTKARYSMHDTVQSLGAHQGTFAITQKATAGGTNTQNSSLNKSERKS